VVTALKMPPSPADVTDVTLRPDVTRE
jgi:hypothetical protein